MKYLILLSFISTATLGSPVIDMMFDRVTYNDKFEKYVYMETAIFNKHGETKSRFVNKSPVDLLCVVEGGEGRFYVSDTVTETELLPITVEFPVYGNSTSLMEYTGMKDKQLSFDCMPLNGSIRGRPKKDLMDV